MIFFELEEFKKEFKRFVKKYPSLYDDLENFKETLPILLNIENNKHLNILNKIENKYFIYKSRMTCRYLKGSSFRIIFGYDKVLNKISFIEIYFKGEKENEDRGRIKDYFKRLSQT
jgi:hypothetical protein